MKIDYSSNLKEFWESHRSFLEATESENAFLVGNLLNHLSEGDLEGRFYLASVNPLKSRVLATWLPKQTLSISGDSTKENDVSPFADDFHQRQIPVHAVWGSEKLASAFSKRWCELTSKRVVKTTVQLLHELTTIEDIPRAKGSMRFATETDLPWIGPWGDAFSLDTQFEVEKGYLVAEAKTWIKKNNGFVWLDKNKPVCMAFVVRESLTGGFIGYVYTPDEARGNGYASSLVAEICKLKLASGWQRAWLHTDAINPVSNRIYKRIGFRLLSPFHSQVYGD